MADQKEPLPNLVKPDGSRQAVGSTMSREELLEVVRAVVGGQQSAESIAATVAKEVAKQAVDAALARTDKPEDRKGDWNVQNFPGVSAFNPAGDKAHPRQPIVGDIWWQGDHLKALDLTPDEIALANQLQPGTYHNGAWKVVNLVPGMTGTRKLLVIFPCKDADQRSQLPSMLNMLREMTGQTAAPQMAGVA